MSWEFRILGIGDFTLNLAPVSRPNLHFHAHTTKAIPIQESAYSGALSALSLKISAKIWPIFWLNGVFYPQTIPKLSPFQNKNPHKAHKYRLCEDFTLFKLAKFGLILVVLIWLSILFCIDNMCLFHTLFFVSHIFSTIPVPLHFFIIVCSSGGLQVGLLFTE